MALSQVCLASNILGQTRPFIRRHKKTPTLISTQKESKTRYFGATHTAIASTDPVAKITGITNDIGADYVFEVIGVPAIAAPAYASPRRGGTTTHH